MPYDYGSIYLSTFLFRSERNSKYAERCKLQNRKNHSGNNAKNVSVENLSVKIYFDTEMLPKDKASREANAKQFKLTDKRERKFRSKYITATRKKAWSWSYPTR